MKYLCYSLLLLTACTGKLSDEQRQKLHEGMATQDIKRVSDAELELAAWDYAKAVMADVEKADVYLRSKSKIDSIAAARHVKIYSLMPADSALRQIEKQLVDAYITGADVGSVGDNLQKIGEDSLLFTKPVFTTHPDGSQQFSHAIGIKMAKKTVVLSMPSK